MRIEEYDNKLTIIVNNFSCEYYTCGSHQMKLNIEIEKDNLINFLNQIDEVKHTLKEEEI